MTFYGDLIPIYAPSTWQTGSSLTHLDEELLGDYLMSSSIAPGQMIRNVSDLEWAMMTDMGWEIVPEPGSLVLFIAGGIILCLKKERGVF